MRWIGPPHASELLAQDTGRAAPNPHVIIAQAAPNSTLLPARERKARRKPAKSETLLGRSSPATQIAGGALNRAAAGGRCGGAVGGRLFLSCSFPLLFFGGRLAGRVAFAGGRIAAGDGGRGRAVIGRMGRVGGLVLGPQGRGFAGKGEGEQARQEDRLGEVVLHGVRDIMARCRRTAEWALRRCQSPSPRTPSRAKAAAF